MARRIGIVVSLFNDEITGDMRKFAEQRANELGVKIVKIVEVPGAFEIPLAVKRLLDDKNIEGVATLGAIIKGGTEHDKVVAESVSRKILDLSIEHKKPVSLGIIGPGATSQQAKKRAGEYARRSIDSVLKMLQ